MPAAATVWSVEKATTGTLLACVRGAIALTSLEKSGPMMSSARRHVMLGVTISLGLTVGCGRGEVVDRRETDAPRLALGRELHRAGNEHLALGATALPIRQRLVLAAQRDLGLVDFDDALEKASTGIDHGAAELRQEQPGTLVTAEA